MKNTTHLLSALLLVSVCALAQAPKTLTYQGKLSDGGGPLNGSFDLTFTIHDAASGGASLWTETLNGVAVTNGDVSLTLGKITPIDIQIDKPLWMGITVDANPEVSPRVELTGNLYSLGIALPYSGTSNSPSNTFEITNTGIGGSAAHFENSNGSSTAPAIHINHAGTGNAITADAPVEASMFIGDGSLLTKLPSTGWGLTGTSGTTDGINFIGTIDSTPLSFRVSNQKAGRIDPALSNSFYGYQTGNSNTSGFQNTAIGHQALSNNTTGNTNTAIGYVSLAANSSGYDNVGIGHGSLQSNATGSANTAVGVHALQSNTTGGLNTGVGLGSLQSNTTGEFNTASGGGVLGSNTGGHWNSGLGFAAMNGNTSGGWNTAVGAIALQSNTAGGHNSALGYLADVSTGNLNNATAIGSGAIVTTSNAIQLGNSSVTQVFAGTGTTTTLIAGGLQITGSSPAVGKVLTSDAAGVATWQNAGGSGWGLTGNAGTLPGTHFIGTTDSTPLYFRVSNVHAGLINPFTSSTFFGISAGATTATGWSNTAMGYFSLGSNTSGQNNTAVGVNALSVNTTGSYNSAFGTNALNNSVSGGNNTAIGHFAMGHNSAGSSATALGYGAMQFTNDTSTPFTNSNVAVGYEALRGSFSPSANTGNENIAVGYRAMLNNTSGGSNVATGYQALAANTTGSNNTATGGAALGANTTGFTNTASGYTALGANTDGIGNTAVGLQSLLTNTNGDFNTAVGLNADVASGNLSNATALGFGAVVNASNKVRIGNTSVTVVESPVAVTVASDRRLKENILDSELGLNFILALRPVQYTMTSGNGKTDYGFIAQELKGVLGNRNVNMLNKDGEFYHVRYNDFISPIVKAMQEQQQMIEELRSEILQVQARLEAKEMESRDLKMSLDSRLRKLEEVLNVKADK